jgi:hypothetical protein
MMDSVSRPLRRLLALTILLAVLVVGWSAVIEPLIDLSRARREEIAGLADQLGRLRAIIGRQPELEQRAAAAGTALTAEGGLWAGSSTAEVAAGMQDRLRKVIADNAGRLRSTAVVGEANEHGFHRVAVHFSIDGTLDTIQATLATAQAARPAMFVDSVAIHATGADDPGHPPALSMELDIVGYMRAAGA